jgi:hypothetical protein
MLGRQRRHNNFTDLSRVIVVVCALICGGSNSEPNVAARTHAKGLSFVPIHPQRCVGRIAHLSYLGFI